MVFVKSCVFLYHGVTVAGASDGTGIAPGVQVVKVVCVVQMVQLVHGVTVVLVVWWARCRCCCRVGFPLQLVLGVIQSA